MKLSDVARLYDMDPYSAELQLVFQRRFSQCRSKASLV